MGNDELRQRAEAAQEDLNPITKPDVLSDIIQDILQEADSTRPPQENQESASAPVLTKESMPAEPPEQDIADLTHSESVPSAQPVNDMPSTPETASREWYRYADEDQVLEDEDAAPAPVPESGKSSRRKKRKAKKEQRRHPILNAISHALLVFLTVFSVAYLVAVYSDIPLVKRVRTIYIQSAMNTVSHKWMATAIIPGEIIDQVLRVQYEAGAAMVGVESTWGAVEITELPKFESEVLSPVDTPVPLDSDDEPASLNDSDGQLHESSSGVIHESDSEENTFYSLFWEVDRDSFEAYLEDHPQVLDEGWSNIKIDRSGLDDVGTDIQTIYGDQVLALNAVDGVILIRVYLSENQSRGVMAICKDTTRLSLCPADTLGVIGQTAGRICDANGGVLAITGSAFIDIDQEGNGGDLSGIAVCSGVMYGSPLGEDSKRLELRNDDKMYIMDSLSPITEGTRDACEFHPAMIVDGEIMETTWNGLEPRSALGQTSRLETIMMVVEGRYADSLGCGVEYVAAKMRQYGCVQAMNLDGGTSAIMYYDGAYVTRCSNSDLPGGRTLPTAWVYQPAN